jgi:GxxExxY protein
MDFDELSNQVIGCALEVHRHLGAGLLESAYEACLTHEMELTGLALQRQYPLPVMYKGTRLDCGYCIDLLVEGKLIVELKTVEKILPIHQAQLLTYMRLAQIPVGLLLNFNVGLLRDGIKRMVL